MEARPPARLQPARAIDRDSRTRSSAHLSTHRGFRSHAVASSNNSYASEPITLASRLHLGRGSPAFRCRLSGSLRLRLLLLLSLLLRRLWILRRCARGRLGLVL